MSLVPATPRQIHPHASAVLARFFVTVAAAMAVGPSASPPSAAPAKESLRRQFHDAAAAAGY
jgi:hypothetical protein